MIHQKSAAILAIRRLAGEPDCTGQQVELMQQPADTQIAAEDASLHDSRGDERISKEQYQGMGGS